MVNLVVAVVDQKETYWTLLHNAAHWEFEATVELVTAVPSFFIGRWFYERNEKKKHKNNLALKANSNSINS
ncbi:MAG TPA: hypothetical protein VMR76_02450 [Candidatus Saccharimonadia bacterium]|nr:hypothetical protein [Candidatus Saccharimonadia bacterium]